ncbi:RNA polymerase sigma factor [Patescibacteria group bacterium]
MALADADDFLFLMQRYEKQLLAYVRRIIGVSREDAEDVIQDVFIKVYQNLNGFDLSLKFSSWIYRITHNQAISHYRKNKSKKYYLSLEDSEKVFYKLASEYNLSDEIQRKITKEKVQKLILQLEAKYRQVLILKFLEDKDYREISDILKKPMGTIATLINRAKAKFKKILIKNNINF